MSIPFWVAMAGWAFTYYNSRSLARQSEANGIVTAVDKMLQEISDENYKFWRDADFSSDDHNLKCHLFHSYVSFRCNFIEARLSALYHKCRNRILHDGEVDIFYPKAIDLLSTIRTTATLDSETSSSVDAEGRRRKILLINRYTMDLHGLISGFMLERYRSIMDLQTKSTNS